MHLESTLAVRAYILHMQLVSKRRIIGKHIRKRVRPGIEN
jgi:hypothetical protein